uniref:Uncharacterized protein n=1 Tax=Arundo donax TaxID=35708 RepID=A0A0A9GQR9_ARUDO
MVLGGWFHSAMHSWTCMLSVGAFLRHALCLMGCK